MTLKYYNASNINQVMVPSLKIQSTRSIRALAHIINDIDLKMVAFITQYFSQRVVILIEILCLPTAIRKHWLSLKITIKIKESICRKSRYNYYILSIFVVDFHNIYLSLFITNVWYLITPSFVACVSVGVVSYINNTASMNDKPNLIFGYIMIHLLGHKCIYFY